MSNKEWYIITPEFKSGKCENPNQPDCGNSNKLLWIKTTTRPRLFTTNKLYVCAKCVKKDFKLVGEWAKSWKDFKNER